MRIAQIGTLVSTNWLKDCLSSTSANKIRILDVSWARHKKVGVGFEKFYMKQHIPGSVYFDLNHCCTPTEYLPLDLPDKNCLSEYIGSLGVSNNSYVIVYDQQNNSSAFRTWWMFKYLGHSNVSLLDGGLSKWIADNYEVTSKPTTYEKCNFEIHLQPKHFRNFEEVMKNLETQKEQILDCRGSNMFHGDPEDKFGHIPNSKNLPYSELFKPDGTMKSKAELKDLFTAAGIDLGKPLISTCQMGVTACGIAAAAKMLGKKEVSVYLGSWHEWFQRADSKNIV